MFQVSTYDFKTKKWRIYKKFKDIDSITKDMKIKTCTVKNLLKNDAVIYSKFLKIKKFSD
jgi:hypothetical protein